MEFEGGEIDRFKVIDGDEKPKPGRRKSAPEQLLICPCGSSETVETYSSRPIKGNRVGKGAKAIRCYHCGKILVE